ncbi:NitT/TauT family transport system permease protein [Mariniphaga anaerophila]|uniref:NitT/TauT family transport system permease protein n=1 Tax=Mariniphaga anaerophila TaxID=1484053 RepID=A0A1M5FDE3_9BACT|nr:ABC transporter permease [Mariniphaga anaerophila]SHF89543.1 NitT/TauT family transport system permease protein [Mariniphaga anaerophila]
MKISITKKQYIGFISVAVMLAVWKLLALYFDSDFIVPHPEDTFLTVLKLFADSSFAAVVGTTVLRGLIGFVISFFLGVGIGIMAGISPGFNAFINPMLVTIRSTPVIALILLALIWFSPDAVPVFIAMLTMFPFICTNVVDGIKSVDSQLIEMARFYKTGKRRIVSEVYLPAIVPFIMSGASSAMGIGWRAIIIGEVLSQPQYGIGTKMQSAQTFLNVDAVIAWTLIAVLISFVFEKIIRWSEQKIVKWKA